jgi:ribosomal protein L30E
MASIATILGAEKDKKTLYGTDRTIKALKRGELKEIVISSNCPEKTVEVIHNLASMSKTKVSKSKQDSVELGAACKKTFSVTVIGLLK